MRRKSRGINKFLQVQGSKFSSFSGSGIKILGKNMGSVTKKYTSLRPCHVIAALRNLRTDCPAGKSWPNHVKNEQHIGSEKTYGPKTILDSKT